MGDGAASFRLSLHRRIAEISAADWDACAGDENPFVTHAFLNALEESGSVCKQTGWLPHHVVVRDSAGAVCAVVPMYAKAHSYGEYVFDHGWAQALHRVGGHYYPKLQVAVPFSPVPGPRLLRRAGTDLPIAALAKALVDICIESEMSSLHITFCQEQEWHALGAAGFLQRMGLQFHWENQGYNTFDDFLLGLTSRRRKQIRRERRDVQALGLTFLTLRGNEITLRHWRAFFRFYLATADRKWGNPYLTERFFPMLSERLGDRVVLMLAEHHGEPVAGALNLLGKDTLYGRNWGVIGEWPFLHFELCYYRAIEFAIAERLKRVEAGAQGEHKLQRGYLPRPTYSAHWIVHSGLRRAVAEFLARERPVIASEIAELTAAGPFRNESSDAGSEAAANLDIIVEKPQT